MQRLFESLKQPGEDARTFFDFASTVIETEGEFTTELLFKVILTSRDEICNREVDAVEARRRWCISKPFQEMVDLCLAELQVDLHFYEAWCKANSLNSCGVRVLVEIEIDDKRQKAIKERQLAAMRKDRKKIEEAEMRQRIKRNQDEKLASMRRKIKKSSSNGVFHLSEIADDDDEVPEISSRALDLAKQMMDLADGSAWNSKDGSLSLTELGKCLLGTEHELFVRWLCKDHLRNYRRFDKDDSGGIDIAELAYATEEFLHVDMKDLVEVQASPQSFTTKTRSDSFISTDLRL